MKQHTTTPIQMRFADADILGHINNVNLQHYFDLGKMDFYRTVLGRPFDWTAEGLILVSTSTSYFGQTRLGDRVEVETYVEKVGTKSVTLYQRLVNADTGVVNAEARGVAVGFDFAAQQSIELLPQWREALESCL